MAPSKSSKRIGELLINANMITPDQLKHALAEQKTYPARLGSTLVRLGHLKDYELTDFLSLQFGVPAINLHELSISDKVTELISSELANKHHILPINRIGSTLIIATSDPTDLSALDDIKFITGYDIETTVASEKAIKEAIDRYYDSSSMLDDIISDFDDSELEVVQGEDEGDAANLHQEVEDAPVIRLVNKIIIDSIKRGASDIHVEPFEKFFRVRYRIDGVLYEIMKPPLRLKNAITSRIKIMSELDIAERRLPQDGRIKMKLSKGKSMDMRVSVLPTLFGEKIVMRLLDQSNLQLDMTKLGLEPEALELVDDAIRQPYGLILVTGPTGSGKTTTLYSALSELNKISENIMTAEDPVEFNLEGVNQVQVRENIGLTFAAALRSFLRQDPDIILVGEMRDLETAEISIKASLTGHLVLSTLHTNDAPSSVTRMINMGVEPFLIVSSVNIIIAQRLARKVCLKCSTREEIPVSTLIESGMDPETAENTTCLIGKGCDNCNHTGYRGRIALYEVMTFGDEVKAAILDGANSMELKNIALKNGMKSLRQSGLSKLIEGITSFQEVLRVTARD